MQGRLSIVLHAHLPFVRHPEHERFLEESWFFEAVTECYLPLLEVMDGWARDAVPAKLTLTLSPTLCAMLADPLLRERQSRHLASLCRLAEKEMHRTRWDARFHPTACFYRERLARLAAKYEALQGDLAAAFARHQASGLLEIATTAATHAVLPLLADEPSSIRGQIRTACDDYQRWFGTPPRGIWLPECAYDDGIEPALAGANLRWFIMETHGVLNAFPQPRYGIFAPIFTPHGIAVFARDQQSAQQVWSREAGYPGDPQYRDFYRDIGFDLELDYIREHLPAPDVRGFTGIKYHRITSHAGPKHPYDRAAALQKVQEHAHHFFEARREQFERVHQVMDQPAVIVAPYDAELFGHWWYEGPEFLDAFARLAARESAPFTLCTPGSYLSENPSLQLAYPAPSSWGEEGHFKVWVNEATQWMFPHLQAAQRYMRELAGAFPNADGLARRALNQAARELMLAQSSDWPFIIHTGTSPDYAARRFKDHMLRFLKLHTQLTSGTLDEAEVARMESADPLFPHVDYRHWQ